MTCLVMNDSEWSSMELFNHVSSSFMVLFFCMVLYAVVPPIWFCILLVLVHVRICLTYAAMHTMCLFIKQWLFISRCIPPSSPLVPDPDKPLQWDLLTHPGLCSYYTSQPPVLCIGGVTFHIIQHINSAGDDSTEHEDDDDGDNDPDYETLETEYPYPSCSNVSHVMQVTLV